MSKTPVWVMVCEQVNAPFSVQKDGDDYILEAIVAEFGKPNVNNRVYTEKEYLPHLEYLQKKIRNGNLIGELDHPDKFTISLKNASHVIESLEYDKSTRTVRGRIKILNNENGMNVRKMLDSGVHLSISSRAAGKVNEDRSVSLKKIFTYDIVADPGFDNAGLTRINESLGFDSDGDVQIYDMSHMSPDMLKLLIEDDSNGVEVGEIKSETVAEWSEHIQQEITSLKARLDNGGINEELSTTIEELRSKVAVLEDDRESLKSELEATHAYMRTMAQYSDVLIRHSNGITNEHNSLYDYVKEYLTSQADLAVNETQAQSNYLNIIGSIHDRHIQFSENIAENLQIVKDKQELLEEVVENMKKWVGMVARGTNNSIGMASAIAEALNSPEHFSMVRESTEEKCDDKDDMVNDNIFENKYTWETRNDKASWKEAYENGFDSAALYRFGDKWKRIRKNLKRNKTNPYPPNSDEAQAWQDGFDFFFDKGRFEGSAEKLWDILHDALAETAIPKVNELEDTEEGEINEERIDTSSISKYGKEIADGIAKIYGASGTQYKFNGKPYKSKSEGILDNVPGYAFSCVIKNIKLFGVIYANPKYPESISLSTSGSDVDIEMPKFQLGNDASNRKELESFLKRLSKDKHAITTLSTLDENELEDTEEFLNEDLDILDPNDIRSRIDKIFEEVKKQKTSLISNTLDYPFLNLISESKQREFLGLKTTEKQKVTAAINTAKPLTEAEVLHVWDDVLKEHESSKQRWILDMPEEYYKVWEEATPYVKNMIARRASAHNLNSTYKIRNFWQTLPELNRRAGVIPLNEEQNLAAGPTVEDVEIFGYSRSLVDDVAAQLSRSFGRQ